MAALRHIAAIRARLLQSADLVPLLASTSEHVPAIYAANIWDIQEPVYPCVTIFHSSGNLAVWATRLIDPCRVQIDCWSKSNSGQPSEMDEYVEAMLHTSNVELSGQNPNAVFKECRKINWTMSMFDQNTRAWRVTSVYLVRVFVS